MSVRKEDGWYVNASAINEIFHGEPPTEARVSDLYNIDIREFGEPIIVNVLAEGRIARPVMLQVNNWRNISAPKSSFLSPKDELRNGGLIRYFLTDGHTTISAISSEDFSRIGLDLGCKVKIHSDCPFEGGFLLLSKRFVTVLGGVVTRLKVKNEKERYALTETEPTRVSLKSTTAALAPKSDFNVKNVAPFDEQRKRNITEATAKMTKSQFANPKMQAPPKSLDVREKPLRSNTNKGHDRKNCKGRKTEDEVPAEYSRPSAPSTLFDFLVPRGTAAVTGNSFPTQAIQKTEVHQPVRSSFERNKPCVGAGSNMDRSGRRMGTNAKTLTGNKENNRGKGEKQKKSTARRFQESRGSNSNTPASSPLFSEKDFPSVDALSQDMSQLSVRTTKPQKGAGRNTWRVNDKCFAPWNDGQIYFATVVSVGPGRTCTVLFDDYGNKQMMEQDLLLTVSDAAQLFTS